MKFRAIECLFIGMLLFASVSCHDQDDEQDEPVDPAAFTPANPCIAEIINTYNLHLEGEPTIRTVTLPEELRDPNWVDSNWSIIASVCEWGGYSLQSYAGRTLTSVYYNLSETCMSSPITLSLLMDNATCICATKGNGKGSSFSGAGWAINDPCQY